MDWEDIYEGQVVRVIDWEKDGRSRPSHWNRNGDMDDYKGCVVTIGTINEDEDSVFLIADDDNNGWTFYPWDFELWHPLPEGNPNVVYKTYKYNKLMTEIRSRIKNKTVSR